LESKGYLAIEQVTNTSELLPLPAWRRLWRRSVVPGVLAAPGTAIGGTTAERCAGKDERSAQENIVKKQIVVHK
jgi:hypothetical protein